MRLYKQCYYKKTLYKKRMFHMEQCVWEIKKVTMFATQFYIKYDENVTLRI